MEPRVSGREDDQLGPRSFPGRGRNECEAAWLAIKTRVLCVFWAMCANMIRAWADGTLDLAAACERARQPAFDDDFAWFAERNRGPAPN